MQLKYRLFQRAGGAFYWQENGAAKRGSLRTKDRAEAERLLLAMNEAHKQPILNLALGRTYLSAHDPRMCTRTWQDVMDEMARHHVSPNPSSWGEHGSLSAGIRLHIRYAFNRI